MPEEREGAPPVSAPRVSVVVPVYNSEKTLPELVQRIDAVFASREGGHELVLVDDGSRDASAQVMRSLAEGNPRVRAISLMRNFGQHNALLCGIRAARGAVVVTLDDDLQHPPEEIPKLLAALDRDLDVVYGTPEVKRHSPWRNLGARAVWFALYTVLGSSIARMVSPFRAFRTSLRSAFAGYRSPFVLVDVLLSWGTTRFGAVAVRHEPRKVGRSNYTAGRLIAHAVNLATGFSVRPLKFASFVGFFFVAFGFVIFAWVIGRYFLQGSSVPGFPFLASLVAILGGAQLFAVGIIGEYIARIHVRSSEQPSYVVRAEDGGDGPAGGAGA